MPDPLIALLAFGLITIVLTAVFYPRHGIVPRLRQGMYLSERVRMEDALKHALHEQLEGRFANTNSLAFSLLHNPCSTTIYTIYKETGSAKWTTVSTMLPLVMGFVVTFVVTQVWRLVG